MCQGRSEVIGCVERAEIPNIIKRWFRVATIVLSVKCSIEYEGRASSKASSAWRLIIIKEDGTLLIHEPEGWNPINWQPKAYVMTRVEGGNVIIEALRKHPREVLRISVESDADVIIVRLGHGRFLLHGTEKEMVDYIARNPHVVESGAQLVSREVSTPHGRVDVVLRSAAGELILVEVKRSTADVDAVYQLSRYVKYYESLGVRVRGVLAAPALSPTAEKALAKLGLRYVKVTPPK